MTPATTTSPSISRRRNVTDKVFWGLCGLAFLLIAGPCISVLVSVIHQAVPALGWQLLTHTTARDGIENAILGTLLLILGVFVIAGSIGVAGGVYLAEYSGGRSGGSLRFFSEVLAGMPSIVIGYIGYITLVYSFHWGYSLMAAWLALSVLVLPYIVKTTEVSLRQVPSALREGAAGLGMPRSASLRRIVLPAALPGITSGLIIALAISTGELAPLLFTANATDSMPSLQLFHRSVPYLTNSIYTDLALPGKRAHATSAAAGVASLVILIILIALGHLVTRRARRQTDRMAL